MPRVATAPVDAFPPIVGRSPQLLILGSLPGVRSLAAGEYYAHPRNAFWPIMGELFGAWPSLPYAGRRAALISARVAVWDVLAQAQRPGSADASIDAPSAVANRFDQFLAEHRSIVCIAFNGTMAAALYRRKVLAQLPAALGAIRQRTLPSTSAAHASLDIAAKLQHWMVLKQELTTAATTE